MELTKIQSTGWRSLWLERLIIGTCFFALLYADYSLFGPGFRNPYLWYGLIVVSLLILPAWLIGVEAGDVRWVSVTGREVTFGFAGRTISANISQIERASKLGFRVVPDVVYSIDMPESIFRMRYVWLTPRQSRELTELQH